MTMTNLVFHSRRMGDQNMHKKYLHCTYGFQIEPLSIEEDAEASSYFDFYIFIFLYFYIFIFLYFSSFETKLILPSL